VSRQLRMTEAWLAREIRGENTPKAQT